MITCCQSSFSTRHTEMMLACSSYSSSTTRGTTHLWEIATLVVSSWDNAKAVAKLAKASPCLFSFLGICSNVMASKFVSNFFHYLQLGTRSSFLMSYCSKIWLITNLESPKISSCNMPISIAICRPISMLDIQLHC